RAAPLAMNDALRLAKFFFDAKSPPHFGATPLFVIRASRRGSLGRIWVSDRKDRGGEDVYWRSPFGRSHGQAKMFGLPVPQPPPPRPPRHRVRKKLGPSGSSKGSVRHQRASRLSVSPRGL